MIEVNDTLAHRQYWGKGLNVQKKKSGIPIFPKVEKAQSKAHWDKSCIMIAAAVSVIEPWSYREEDLIANIVSCQVHFPGILLSSAFGQLLMPLNKQ